MINQRQLGVATLAVFFTAALFASETKAWVQQQAHVLRFCRRNPLESAASHHRSFISKHSSTAICASIPETEPAVPSSPSDGDNDDEWLSAEEWKIVSDLHSRATQAASDAEKDQEKNAAFQSVVEEALPKFSPSLIMKLRSGESGLQQQGQDDDKKEKQFHDISQSLEKMLNQKLETARDILTELMNAGEIKKLDALIGKAARAQQLDVAFFQVLQMNIHDAAMEIQQQQQQQRVEKGQKQGEDVDETAKTANRLQILQHIHTRCQEEVEKTINPGIALLSKLLRTDVDSIRRNQLEHYLCPQPTSITAPDGKQIELKNPQNEKSLVDHQDFVAAIANAVKQIRTVEQAGGTDRNVAASMVESCRQVAKEARIVIGERFGKESEQLQAFEDALMPVFRPSSPESPYIQGETTTST
ncbi:hypothetical protein IV203_008289 [Nitzschia inconspicua]|uniref:Secreted protein n=1 Tax=Nitzschia inconspicua TaxID=303405 RepID=A0A9K3PMJ3_9STRA|nr:hypothetical protein IV203_008289 [Nitzschia inconspicua]